MTDHTQRNFCPAQLLAISLVLCSVWAVITLLSLNKPHFHIPLLSLPFFSSPLCLCFAFCCVSVSAIPWIQHKRAEPFQQTFQFRLRTKQVTQQFRPPGTEPTPNAANSEYICKPQPNEHATRGKDRAIRPCSSLEPWCFNATCSSAMKRESWCFWDCGLCVCWETSSAGLFIALLQHHACFNLSPLIFEEQILPFCSHRSRLLGLTRGKRLSRGVGSYFSAYLHLGFFLWPEASSFHYRSLLFEIHISVSHWLDFICQGFVVIEDDTVTALSGAISCEGMSPHSPSVNPIVFSPMWGKGDLVLSVHMCLRCLWITERSGSAVELFLKRENVTGVETVVLGSQYINLGARSQCSVEAAFQQKDKLKYDLLI